MKDGAVRKENSCFNPERIRMRDSSLEIVTEFFRIGRVETRKGQSW